MEKYFQLLRHHDGECGCGSGCGCNHDDNHECNHDHDDEFEQKIKLVLDDGTELICVVLATFELKDKEYMALLPEEQEDVFLYEYKDHDGELELINIEDDEEFDLVSKAFYEMFEEDEDYEDEE